MIKEAVFVVRIARSSIGDIHQKQRKVRFEIWYQRAIMLTMKEKQIIVLIRQNKGGKASLLNRRNNIS